ncbi:MAG TPA: hypothetical protein DCY88_27030 [Cyanobacteria bacterium UBA11372]|nr:hypothetical protein [Cyanobacteria bacterium UBA11372]
MKTDTIFYSLFQAFPSIFFELINQSPEEATDYEFTSREVKQLAFRLDGLFLPKSNDLNKPFYAVEVQFQPDPDLYYRLFSELFLYLRQYKPDYPWRVVVIYPSRSVEREENTQFGELIALNRVRRIYLDELGEAAESSLGVNVVKLVIEAEETAPALARELIAQTRQQVSDEAIKRDLIDLIETIIVYKLPQKSREEIEVMLGLNELRQTRVFQEALEEGRQEGREEGRQEGREEGRQEGKLQSIPPMIEFGLSKDAIAQILDLAPEVVEPAATSFHQQNLTAFIQLVNSERSLFSPPDLVNLEQLIASLPDNLEELSLAIVNWYKQPEKSQIFARLVQLRQTLTNNTSETPENQLNKQTLLNAIANCS